VLFCKIRQYTRLRISMELKTRVFRLIHVQEFHLRFDEHGAHLYHMDPSGTYLKFDAKAIGSGSEGAQQSLQVRNTSRVGREP
jgi:20S proteasome alpha/beta subunit